MSRTLTDDEELITLKDASAMLFGNRISPDTLKDQWRKGNLVLSKIGRSYFASVADFKGLKDKCLADPPAQGSGSIKPARRGRSLTGASEAAQDSALMKLQERKKRLGITSRSSTR